MPMPPLQGQGDLLGIVSFRDRLTDGRGRTDFGHRKEFPSVVAIGALATGQCDGEAINLSAWIRTRDILLSFTFSP